MASERILRHKAIDRLFHWVTAASVLTLLATGLLPVLGIDFNWITIHWVAGVVLIAVVLFHIVRASFWQSLRSMAVGPSDLAGLSAELGFGGAGAVKPGKYLVAQRLMHHVITIFALTAIVTGALMLTKIDTPFWKRQPYWLQEHTWGIVYALHDLAAMAFVSLIMLHVYFALRPEKISYTRAMIAGWMSRQDYLEHHDPAKWPADGTSKDQA
jgi:formate dehydrogenase subunit gamma